jgi:hypothetical protein
LGSNVVKLKNTKLLIQVENVKENSSNLKFYLQKIGLKEKSKHVEKQKPHPQIYLQKFNFKIKVQHVEKITKSTNRSIETTSQGESRICKRMITIINKDKNHILDLQPNYQIVFRLSLDPRSIYNPKHRII